MTVEIIGFPRSNFVRTVRMVAHEKGMDYELLAERPHSDAVKAIHPLGQIPVMRHDGVELFESMAIAQYFEAVFDGPRTIPTDPKAAARVIQWGSFVQTLVDRLLMRQYVVEYAFHKDEDGNVVRDEIDKALKRFPSMFRKLDAAVADGFLGGADFSLADCFLMPILFSVQHYPEGEEVLKGSAALSAYYDRLAARPSFAGTAP